jgi:Asp-tRNA(Asn)/Glu-tRNA(Gln) amidotransferase B subunit
MRLSRKRKRKSAPSQYAFDLLRESISGEPSPQQILELGRLIQIENRAALSESVEAVAAENSDFNDFD